MTCSEHSHCSDMGCREIRQQRLDQIVRHPFDDGQSVSPGGHQPSDLPLATRRRRRSTTRDLEVEAVPQFEQGLEVLVQAPLLSSSM